MGKRKPPNSKELRVRVPTELADRYAREAETRFVMAPPSLRRAAAMAEALSKWLEEPPRTGRST